MQISQKALDFENRSIGVNSEPTLAKAYQILEEQWKYGDRDREIGLHLMFLAWYGIIEPKHLTGFRETDEEKQELNQMIVEVHDYFEPQIYQDAEMLYAFGLMADMFWYMFDNASIWEERAKEYKKLYRSLAPNGIDPKVFHDRGA